VSSCATCDGFFFREHDIAVVGGGDSAMEEATFLTKFGASVTIVHRRDEFRASKIMLERAKNDPKIRWRTGVTVEEVLGENGSVKGLRLRDVETGEDSVLDVTAMFVAIGHDPRSGLVRDQLATDDAGYVLTETPTTYTRIPGVFAAGDLVDHTYRQAVTAAGSGTQAALDAEWYLRDTPGIPVPAKMAVGDPAEAQYAPPAGAGAGAGADGASGGVTPG
jgi:thioredoxin reductase (NADPH)